MRGTQSVDIDFICEKESVGVPTNYPPSGCGISWPGGIALPSYCHSRVEIRKIRPFQARQRMKMQRVVDTDRMIGKQADELFVKCVLIIYP